MGRILIVGGDADFNLGDTAILLALVQCIARSAADIRITLLSSRPDFHRQLPRHTIVLRRSVGSWLRLLDAARRQDLIIVGGGGLFQDDDSRIKMPYWTARIAALRAVNRNVVGHALGAGPLRHPESQEMARAACGMLRTLSVRDAFAQSWLARCMGREPELIPDPAFMLAAAPPGLAQAYLRSLGMQPERPFIAVALRRWFHPLGGFVPHRLRARAGLVGNQGEAGMQQLLASVSQAVAALAKRLDAAVLLMPTYNVAHEADHRQCARLAHLLPGIDTAIAAISDPALYKAVVGRAQLLIAARMHPLILAAGMGVPIVGLAYNGKFDGLFRLLRLTTPPLWLEDFRRESQATRLEDAAFAALNEGTDLKARAAELACSVERRTRNLVADSLAA